MQDYISFVKQALLDCISKMSTVTWLFVRNPGHDFTRKRKLDFESLFRLLISMEGRSLGTELLDFFHFSVDTVSVSALNQQRAKLLPEALEFLFHEFTDTVLRTKTWNGFRLLACDGSDLNIFRNPQDKNTYYQSTPSDKGFNQLHLNAFYDLCNHIYTDTILQDRADENEYRACVQMMERSTLSDSVILIADRGYENYNTFAHAQEKGWKFLIRVKDIHSNGILSGLGKLPDTSFDKQFSFLLTRRQTKEIKSHPGKYKFMPSCQTFDYLPIGSKETYPITFRVVRFLIGDNSYESIITNLPAEEFKPDKIKELYHMRWGIETSFRELKYTIGLTSFHAKKVDFIKQEIYAKLILYNYCEFITNQVVIEKPKRTKHRYQVNFTRAVSICKRYLKSREVTAANVACLIQKYILPVRPGRHDPRKVKPQTAVGFLYRVA